MNIETKNICMGTKVTLACLTLKKKATTTKTIKLTLLVELIPEEKVMLIIENYKLLIKFLFLPNLFGYKNQEVNCARFFSSSSSLCRFK